MADDNSKKDNDDFWECLNKALDKGTNIHQNNIRKGLSPTGRQLGKSVLPNIPKIDPHKVVGRNPTFGGTNDLPWNSTFTGGNGITNLKFYEYKHDEHTGRVVFGDKQAVAYDKLAKYTEELNKTLQRYYPNKYYTVEDVYNTAKSYTCPWGQEKYLGYKDAFLNLSTGIEFWNTIAELGDFNPDQFGSFSNLLIPDTERASGRSTKQLFEYCSMLLENPNKWIRIKDHSRLPQVDRQLAEKVMRMLREQNLKVAWYEYRDPNTGESVFDLKLDLIGTQQYERNKLICNPRTLSTPVTSPKS